MRLSPPIAVLSLIATSLASLAVKNAGGDQNWKKVLAIEISATIPRAESVSVGHPMTLRSGTISIERTGAIRLTVVEQTLDSKGLRPEHIVKTIDSWSLSAANQAFPIAEQLFPAAIDVDDQIGLASFSEGRGGKDRNGRSTHVCAHQKTDIFPDTVIFKSIAGAGWKWTAAPAFCVDSYSESIRSQIQQIRRLALSALNVDIEAEMTRSK